MEGVWRVLFFGYFGCSVIRRYIWEFCCVLGVYLLGFVVCEFWMWLVVVVLGFLC